MTRGTVAAEWHINGHHPISEPVVVTAAALPIERLSDPDPGSAAGPAVGAHTGPRDRVRRTAHLEPVRILSELALGRLLFPRSLHRRMTRHALELFCVRVPRTMVSLYCAGRARIALLEARTTRDRISIGSGVPCSRLQPVPSGGPSPLPRCSSWPA